MEIDEKTSISLEAKVVLFALAAHSGFRQTRIQAALHTEMRSAARAEEFLRQEAQRVPSTIWQAAQRELKSAADLGHRTMSILCSDYPPLLREIPDPPLLLFVRGAQELPADDCAAVVGARRAEEGSLEMAAELGCILAEQGHCVVSGLALGVDAAAHTGALRRREALMPTVAVLGSGIEEVQPRQNERLAAQLLEQGGAIVSEFGIHAGAQRHHFPMRNRIIAGLSRRVIIVEAAERSGSLITARLALEQGRDVFVVPGPPLSSRFAGSNRLLREGAQLLLAPEELADSVVMPESFSEGRSRRALALISELGLDEREQEIVRHVVSELQHYESASLEQLCEREGGRSEQVRVLLSLLELEGAVHQKHGLFRLGQAIDS